MTEEHDGTQEEIFPGYIVEYICDTRGPHSGDRVHDIASAHDCAKLCQERPGCSGTSWAVKYQSSSVATGAGDKESKAAEVDPLHEECDTAVSTTFQRRRPGRSFGLESAS